jgi:hypothetical protein
MMETSSLGLIDDIFSIQKGSSDTLKINAAVVIFIERNKLKISAQNLCEAKKKEKISLNALT